MERDYKLKTPTRNNVAIKSQNTEQKKYWREKEEWHSSMIYLCATESQNLWHLDRGCSKHMTDDSSKFTTLKYHKGKVTFGDSFSSRIIDKGTTMVNTKIKEKNVLLVENLKANVLDVS